MHYQYNYKYWLVYASLFMMGSWAIILFGDNFITLFPTIIRFNKPIFSISYGIEYITFVNIFIFVCIFGIIYVLSKIKISLVILTSLLLFFENLFGRTIIFLFHNPYVCELILYYCCYCFVIDGVKNDKEHGIYISLYGVVCYGFLLIWNNYCHDEFDYVSPEYLFLMLFTLIPLTYHFKSLLFGFCSVGIFYWLFGFAVHLVDGVYLIGFSDNVVLHRIIKLSLILVTNFTIIKRKCNKYIQSFRLPIQVFALIMYFLILLIMSSKIYCDYIKDYIYIIMQIIMISSLIGGIILGSKINIHIMIYISIIFFVFFIQWKTSELVYLYYGMSSHVIFINCVIILFIIFYLRTRS